MSGEQADDQYSGISKPQTLIPHARTDQAKYVKQSED